jgi:hypothetical protein
MSEVEKSVEQDLEKVKNDLGHAFRELSLLREEVRTNMNSRRGLPGVAGPVGPAGADAVIKIVQADGKVQVVDLEGKVHAEFVAVPGPKGDKGDIGHQPAPIVGPAGKDGRNAPTLDEIVKAVLAHIKTSI